MEENKEKSIKLAIEAMRPLPESCLCQVDIENTLDSAGIKYIEDCGDYIIIK